MASIISVKPIGDGWSVQADTLGSEMIFLSGAKAEAAARRLAGAWARNGESSEIRIFLRDGALAGRFDVPAATLALAG